MKERWSLKELHIRKKQPYAEKKIKIDKITIKKYAT